MRVLGIDPGSHRTGYGMIEREGSRLLLRSAGVLRVPSRAPLMERLALLHERVLELMRRHEPSAVGIESVFHGPNTRSLVTLGQARGAILAAVGRGRGGGLGPTLLDLSPSEVKKAVTGNGSATKDQVAHMVGAMLGAEDVAACSPTQDATDALAVAIATVHRHRTRSLAGEG